MLLLAGDILRRTARRLPWKAAILCGEESLDFAALDTAANRFANALSARGIAKGETIAIMSGNYPAYGIVHYGAARAGAVLANINARASAAEAARILASTEAKLIVVEASLVALAEAARQEAGGRAEIVAFGAGPRAVGRSASLDELLAESDASEPRLALSEDDPLGLTFTGGTTGLPKGVLASHRARGLSALTTLVEFNLGEEDIAAVATPLFHVAALYIWFHPAVMCGATSVFLPHWDVERFVAMVERHHVSAALLVPTQINDLVKHPSFAPERLRTLVKVNHAGMPMPVALIERVQQTMPWLGLTDHYGTSEAGALCARQPHHLPAKAGSVGRPAFNVEIEIRGPDGKALSPGQVGEVTTRGEHLMLGYYKDARATAAAYRNNDGWFWTGDLGYADDDGFIVLVDRSKDVLVQGGENIFPLEIEQVLYRHPAVLECAVIGIPDERLGEVPAAHVVLRAGCAASESEIIEFCLKALPRHKRPRRVAFVEGLPKSAIGKIQKHKIRDPYWAGRARRI